MANALYTCMGAGLVGLCFEVWAGVGMGRRAIWDPLDLRELNHTTPREGL